MAARYVTLAEVKARVEQSGTGFDTILDRIIDAAEAAVDTITERVWEEPAAGSARLLTPRSARTVLPIDEATQAASAEVREGTASPTWTALPTADWELVARGEYSDALVRLDGRAWPCTRYGEPTVRVTAHWASTADVPPDIKEATLILVSRLFKRPTVPLGVQQIGTEIAVRLGRADPDVHALLERHIKIGVGV